MINLGMGFYLIKMSISLNNLKRTLKPCFRKSASIPTKLSSQDYIGSPYIKQSLSKESKKKPEQPKPNLKAFNKNTSFITQNRLNSSKLFTAVTSLKKKTPEQRLEQKLEARLKYSDSEGHFEVYQQIFSEVIRTDRQFSAILERIKQGYEQKIGCFALKNLQDLLSQVKDQKEKCLEKSNEINNLENELRLARAENSELSKTLDMTESLYLEIHEKLQKIYNSDISEFTLNENTWKFVVNENKLLRKKVEKLNVLNEELNFRQNECFKFIETLKDQKAYPAKELMEKIKELKLASGLKFQEDSCDSENLVSEGPNDRKRPKGVPKLLIDFDQSHSLLNDTDSDLSLNIY